MLDVLPFRESLHKSRLVLASEPKQLPADAPGMMTLAVGAAIHKNPASLSRPPSAAGVASELRLLFGAEKLPGKLSTILVFVFGPGCLCSLPALDGPFPGVKLQLFLNAISLQISMHRGD